MSSICQEKEMIDLIFSMYQLSGGSDGEVLRKLTESEQTVCRSVVFSKLFFNTDDHIRKEWRQMTSSNKTAMTLKN